MLSRVRGLREPWDIVVIGGGATGVGCALDAATRGYKVLLLEQHDFGKGTSSRSTKLIHGGVRYLRQGNIRLVREALRERSTLLKNAPHVVYKQEFIVPCYGFFDKHFYSLGLKVYDRLAGKNTLGRSQILSASETIRRLPTIKQNDLSGGVLYVDGQFDDTRLLIDMAQTAASHGACLLNYARVGEFLKNEDGRIVGVEFTDIATGGCFSVHTKVVINAAGIFSDAVDRLANENSKPTLTFAQGTHLVLDKVFLAGDAAILIPKTSDGRVLFCIPWQEHLLIGTTDTPVANAALEPQAHEAEIDFILETAREYLSTQPTRADIKSVFVGIRPLVKNESAKTTAALSRGYELSTNSSGLVTVTGGKWTTYRRMAEAAVDKAAEVGALPKVDCKTESVQIEPSIKDKASDLLHPELQYGVADVRRAVHEEMAFTVEDVLARRTRALFLNAKAALETAPSVAKVMADELGKGEVWVENQLSEFCALAENYLPKELVPNKLKSEN